MRKIDYMKVIDIISKLFEADRRVDLDATHDKIDMFYIKAKCVDGREISYSIHLHKYEMVIIIDKIYFDKIKFDKWLSKFEYELEQTFFTNIEISTHEETTRYRINITS